MHKKIKKEEYRRTHRLTDSEEEETYLNEKGSY